MSKVNPNSSSVEMKKSKKSITYLSYTYLRILSNAKKSVKHRRMLLSLFVSHIIIPIEYNLYFERTALQ